jgi:GNAT superfamily N-acetyltransferase
MAYLIRKITLDDLPQLASLLSEYMRETYRGEWGGNERRLAEDIFEGKVKIAVAETAEGKIIAFISWIQTYDLHWCLRGGDVIDMFVSRPYRGRGLAMLLLTDTAREILDEKGAFLKGGAVDNPMVHRLYQRIAMRVSGNDYYLSGRAFRRLAELSGKKVREIVRNLPPTAWNYEP